MGKLEWTIRARRLMVTELRCEHFRAEDTMPNSRAMIIVAAL